MKANFYTCLSEVLKHEGGYVNDPQDPGGETNMGISKRAYPNENIRGMTRERAAMIYRRDYWDAVQGDKLPTGLDLVAFDAAVNSGVSRGAKWLQMGLGVPADGRIGPKTINAANVTDLARAINTACDQRMAFLRSLAGWPRFGKGWTTRVDSIRAKASGMAATTSPVPAPEPPKSFWAWLKSLFGG